MIIVSKMMKLLRGHYNVSVSVLICIAHSRKTPSVMGGLVPCEQKCL